MFADTPTGTPALRTVSVIRGNLTAEQLAGLPVVQELMAFTLSATRNVKAASAIRD